MSIHREHPFADPVKDPGRQFRGRLGGRVSLWTSGAGAQRAGLTVSSLLAVPGDSWTLVGALNPASDLAIELLDSGTAVVSLLERPQLQLAEVFAGLAPSPGGPFADGSWEQTQWGPLLVAGPDHPGVGNWAGVRLAGSQTIGFQVLVACTVEHFELSDDPQALMHYRGHYSHPPQAL